jgi:hypothetical protein
MCCVTGARSNQMLDRAVCDFLQQCAGRHHDQPGAPIPIRLRPRKKAVEEYNAERLGKLLGAERVYTVRDTGDTEHLRRCIAYTKLLRLLKEGAHVICMYNLPQRGLAKESQGIVVEGPRSCNLSRLGVCGGEQPIQVAWYTPGGGEAREHDMYPADFKDETIEGVVQCCRRQYPLSLGQGGNCRLGSRPSERAGRAA